MLRKGPVSARPARRPDSRRTDSRRTATVAVDPALDSELRALFPAAAFFDLDNTVLRGAAMFHLARGLYERKFFTRADIARAAWWQAYFRIAGVEDPDHMLKSRSKALAFIANRKARELSELSEIIVDEKMMDKLWPGTLRMAQQHLDAGDEVWLVTAAPIEVARVIAERLHFTGALASLPEQIDGAYTGMLVGDLLHGPAKATAVADLAVERGLDLERCAAYSDSHNDVTMLSLVGNPCAVNPDARLRAYAQAHGWRIRDYRRGRRAARAVGVAIGIAVAMMAGAAAVSLARRRWRH